MEENSDILLAGGDALVTWANQYTKNIPQNCFGAIYLVRTYLMTDFSTPLSLYIPVHIFDVLPSIPLVTYVFDGWPISQPKNK